MVKIKNNRKKSSKKSNKGKQPKKNEINKEIIGIVIISIGILSLVSMYSNSTGSVGKLIRLFFTQAAGVGSNVIPFLVIVIGILFIFNRLNLHEGKRSLALLTIFVSFLIILDVYYFQSNFDRYYDVLTKTGTPLNEMGFIKRVAQSGVIGEEYHLGGGIIGAMFSYFIFSMFGKIGSYIVVTSLILVSFLVLTDLSFVDVTSFIAKNVATFFKKLLQLIKESLVIEKKTAKKADSKSKDEDLEKLIKIDENNIEESKKSDNKEGSNNSSNTSEMDKKIRILDYTKETKSEDKVEDKVEETKKLLRKEEKKNEESTDKLPLATEESYEDYRFPSLDFLNDIKSLNKPGNKKEILIKARKLESTLDNFGINAKITQISRGPTITRFEVQPAPGVKVSKIVNLSDDIALGLAASDIRIEAPIPGKSAIGIEVPNKSKANVLLKDVLQSEEYVNMKSKVPFALGKDITGKPIIGNIEKMPHLLIAGATGSGKSVCINTLISSILYKARPDEVKLLMIDPKVVELGVYNNIPHLLIPVVTDPKKAAGALNWAVQEMTNRYKIFASNGVRDIYSYNKKAENNEELEKLTQIVIIIDELADLMMVSPSEVEDYICRLAQMARAAGIHLIIATQRPSVDVITGTIKANIPSRISFAVSSQTDSRTILGMGGAEKLLGKGDMLYHPVGASKPVRIQGAFIDEEEVEKIVSFLKNQNETSYKEEIIDDIEKEADLSSDDSDELLPDAIELVVKDQQASISMLQRRLRIGYNRAARLVDEMEARGIVGGHEGSKPRKVLVSEEDLDME
ncbi:DNA translocase FtsK [Sporosalibacterium faouarense]|uniref:DNA translocase FtsK n=1 Tax=Sporosalibacterium faouarense TaxID=516123 RepID=UPI00192B04D0|nr:DNA translocase FtsK [Sporosalibacterium faouarense]